MCFHDLCKYPLDMVETALNGQEAEYIGDSDSGLLFHVENFLERYPEARWAIVVRNRKDAEASTNAFFAKHSIPFADSKTVFDLMGKKIDEAFTLLGDRCKIVSFESLNDGAKVKELWDWLTPINSWNQERYEMLQTFDINVIPSKITIGA